MRSFLKGRMLWHYCTGALTVPVKGAKEEDAAFLDCMIEWDSHNHIISHGFRTLPFPPSPTCWAALMIPSQRGICWPKSTPLLMAP